MKKLLLSLIVIASTAAIATARLQTTVVKEDKTVKKTSSAPQKVHNTFSKHKKHNGTKTKEVKEVKTTTPAQ